MGIRIGLGLSPVLGSGAPFTPAAFPSLAMWFDASNTASITESGGAVSQWSDLSGNGRHATQSTAGAKPTTGSVTVNGRNALSFDGGDFLSGSSPAISQPRSLYMVVVANAHDASRRVAIETGTGGTDYAQLQLELGTTNRLTSLTNDGALKTNLATVDFPTAEPVICTVIRSGSAQTLYADGVQQDTDAIGTIVGTGATTFVIGSQRSTLDRYWKGSICEVIDYTATHDAGQLATVVAYLTAKWGVS